MLSSWHRSEWVAEAFDLGSRFRFLVGGGGFYSRVDLNWEWRVSEESGDYRWLWYLFCSGLNNVSILAVSKSMIDIYPAPTILSPFPGPGISPLAYQGSRL